MHRCSRCRAGTLTVIAGDVLAISGISVADLDVDEDSGQLKVTLSVTNGLLSAEGESGTMITRTGTLTEVNAFLAELTYQNNATGTDTLTVEVDDQRNTGSPGAQTDTKTVSIEVVDDSNTAPNLLPITDVGYAIVGVPFQITVKASDPDGDALTLSLDDSSPESANLNDNGDGTGIIEWTPTAGDVGRQTFEVLVTDDGVPPKPDFQRFTVDVFSSIVVDTLVDEDNGNTDPGDLSLREAINLANDTPGRDAVIFDSSLDGGTISLLLGEMEITEALVVDATSLASGLTIDAQESSRIFKITATSGDFTIAGLTLTGGKTTGDNSGGQDNTNNGGAIRSLTSGNLTIDRSTVSGNSTEGLGADGGGVHAQVDVTLTNSTVSGNRTAGLSTTPGNNQIGRLAYRTVGPCAIPGTTGCRTHRSDRTLDRTKSG
ncbi:MAG: Ig-like domain-containing protein [Pirellulales bacterium]